MCVFWFVCAIVRFLCVGVIVYVFDRLLFCAIVCPIVCLFVFFVACVFGCVFARLCV